MEPISLRTPLALLLISLGMIAAVWWWLATPITLPRAPIDPKPSCCASLMRRSATHADAAGADHPHCARTDRGRSAQLAKVSDCVDLLDRNGLDKGAGARGQGRPQVIQGIWLGSNRLKTWRRFRRGAAGQDYPGSSPHWSWQRVLLRGK